MLIDHAGLTPSRAVALLGESPKESGLQQRQYTYVVRHAQQNITQGLEACPTIRIPDARSANPRVRVMGFVAGEYADGVADVPFGPVTWLPQRIGVEFIYDRVASPVAIKTTPSVLECGNVAGTETRVCNRGFVVEQANGSALPSGRLSFSVAPTAMTGNPTVAKLGGAGTLQVMANGSPVPLDGTTWAGDVTQNPSFVPRITGTGAEMGGKSLNITTTFTAN
ncbi:hypothetical protein D6R50_23045 [Aeromonas veronii]|uniref:Fimbrial-type adhesion domain-containing protein n=2 Tax=Aeromonas veronii TaxID=654 RepID=A0A3A9IHB4_AERVE|nr:hypothetical protein [Aeromonas veronii]RKJ84526.1 hypothetical protein D6R50_23045 [Aeromonas veronii]